MKTERLYVRLPEQLHNALENHKEETGLTMSEVTRAALMEKLEARFYG